MSLLNNYDTLIISSFCMTIFVSSIFFETTCIVPMVTNTKCTQIIGSLQLSVMIICSTINLQIEKDVLAM